MENPRDELAAISSDPGRLADHGVVATDEVQMGIGPGAMALPASNAGWAHTFSSLRIGVYRLMFASTMASFLGMMMDQVARGWLTWELTGKASSVGIVSSAWGLPMLVFSLFGGVLADRLEKRNVIVVAQSLICVLTIAIAVLVLTDLIQIWHLVVAGLLQGTIFAFNAPSRQAIIPELVGEKEMMNAIALNSAGMNLTSVLGPAIAGLLVAAPFVGIEGIFFITASTYALSVMAVSRIRVSSDWRGGVRQPILTDIFSGISYIRGNPVLLTLISTALLLIMFGMPLQALMPVFAGDVFDVGPRGLGFLQAASGVGAIAGTLWVAFRAADMTGRGRTQLTAALAFGGMLFLFGFTSSLWGTFWLGLLLLPLVGLTSQVFMAVNNTMLMTYTDHEVRGRVMSVYMMTWSLMPLAILPMGFLSDSIGIANVVAGAAALIIVGIISIWIFRPSYRQIQ